MNELIQTIPAKASRADHAALISAALVKGVEAAIEAGHRLAVAQAELPRPEFLAMLDEDLHITEGTASKLKSIASHPILSELSHGKALPPNWSVLYALTQVPRARLLSAIENGDIHPDMQRKDVRALLLPSKQKQRDDDLPPGYEGSIEPEPDTPPPVEDPTPDDGATERKDSEPNPLVTAWANASRKVRHDFVRACWVEIKRARDRGAKLNGGGGADHWADLSKKNAEQLDRWIEGDNL
jgi:hypothetical protein